MQMQSFIRQSRVWARVLVAVGLLASGSLFAEPEFYSLPGGVIPNESVAREVAEIYLTVVYGKAQVQSQLPLTASLNNKVWTVKGTFNRKHSVGGVAEIDLAQQDGKILRLIHTM